MKQLLEWAKGNPGAMTFLMSLMEGDGLASGMVIIPILEKYNIRGTDLYVLWSDLCGKDNDKVAELITNCPQHILEDACSRQDYSGRALVADYMSNKDDADQASHETGMGM